MKKKSTSQSAFFNLRVLLASVFCLAGVLIALNAFGVFSAHAQQKPRFITYSTDPLVPVGFDCSRIQELGIDKQTNMRAGAIMIACGESQGGSASSSRGAFSRLFQKLLAPLAYGGVDINLITGAETSPNVTQSESWVWGNGNTIVALYNDSRGRNFVPTQLCGASVSTDGGATFTRLNPSPFSGQGSCSGDPFGYYSVRAGKWFAGFFAGNCGGDIGQWESTDGVSWVPSGCIITTGSQDRFSGWVDNNPASPFYGYQYVSSNDFAVGGGALVVTRSTDDGVTWSAPLTLFASFRRNVQMTGSLGADGAVFVQAMDEGGGGLTGPRQNYIYRSLDGGATWTQIQQNAATFLGPGRGTCGYFAGMYTTPVSGYWRHMGWGQPGVGPGGVVHYAYADRPAAGGDPGNIKYIRSTDNGTTWSAPIQLNADVTTRAQWMPSLAVNAAGLVFVSWYDERNTVGDNLERWGRASTDNGATWEPDMSVSDVAYPKPLQPDPGIQACYAGDYDYATFNGNGQGSMALQTWTDGRVLIGGQSQQDVFFDQAAAPTPTASPSPTAAPTPAAPRALRPTDVTATSFTANWSSVNGATGYRLDVSTGNSFVTYVPGYQDLDVGNTTSWNVTGLTANTFYYYRVRAYNGNGTSPNSNVVKVKTKR
jgi:hypothetical protein